MKKYADMTAEECAKYYARTYWKTIIIYTCILIFFGAIFIAEDMYIDILNYGNDAAQELYIGLNRVFWFYFIVFAILCAIIFCVIVTVKSISFKEIYLILGDSEKYIEAEELVKKKIPFFRADGRRKCIIANAYLALGDYDNAWKWYEKIIPKKISKCHNIYNMFGLACYFFAVKNYEEAEKYLARLEKLKATVVIQRLNLKVMIAYLKSIYAIREGRYEDAKKLINRDIDNGIFTNQMTCYNLKAQCNYNLACCAYENGDYIEAIIRYRAAVACGGKLSIVDKAKEKLEELEAKIIKD